MNTQPKMTIARGQRSEIRCQRSEYALRSTLPVPSKVEGHAPRAFTLVELLVVIAIIALLLGIITPTYLTIMEKGRWTKAKTTVKNLETAFKNYLDCYRIWPEALAGGTACEIKGDVFKLLSEKSGDRPPFYEFEIADSAIGALDAWSNTNDPSATWRCYWVQVDHDYDNQINKDGGLYRTVIVWSPGADRSNGTPDDVKSWD